MDRDLENAANDGTHLREREKILEVENISGEFLTGFSGFQRDIRKTMSVGLVPFIERLLYLFLVELFVIFIIYTHYPSLDRKNRFLTPLITGAITSLMGQTITRLFQWMRLCGSLTNKEETSPVLPHIWRTHFKFLFWGGLSGLLTNLWIEFLIETFEDKRYMCIILDQTIATWIFQALFVLFSNVWDVEFSDGDPLSWNQCWRWWLKLVKLNYMVWPYVSVFCFVWAPQEWIFPINCAAGTLFAVVLATSSL